MQLQEKVAVITGSTAGVGLAYARALAAAGAHLLINGPGGDDQNEPTRSALEREFKVKVMYSSANVASPAEIAAMVEEVVRNFGSIDILIAHPGATGNPGIPLASAVEDIPLATWDDVIAVNLSSAFYITRAVVPHMKARGWGRIIATGSAFSLVAATSKSAYVAAKHGIAGLTKALALELATHGITVNCISPGHVWTPAVERPILEAMKARGLTRDQAIDEILAGAHPTRAFVTPEQVAAAALFLCSDAASQITGANISVDGGWTAA